MRPHLKRNAMLAIAAIAILAAVLILALPGGHRHRSGTGPRAAQRQGHSILELAAEYLQISPHRLRARLRAGATLAGVADTTPGKSQAGLIRALLAPSVARLDSEHVSAAERQAALARLRAHLAQTLRHRTHQGLSIAGAALYLGVEEATLAERLHGHSLAEVAEATRGHSAKGLIESLTASRRRLLEAARGEGRLSASAERAALSSLQSRITKDVRRRRS
jgi:hypothetical protein